MQTAVLNLRIFMIAIRPLSNVPSIKMEVRQLASKQSVVRVSYKMPLRFTLEDLGGATRKSWPTQVLADCMEILSVQSKPSSVPTDPLPSATKPELRALAAVSTCCELSPKQSARNLQKYDLNTQHTATMSITPNIATTAMTGVLRTSSSSAIGFSQVADVEIHFPLQQYSSMLPGEPQCSSREQDKLHNLRQYPLQQWI